MSRPQSASPETDIQSTETEVLTSASVRNAESETLIPEKIEAFFFLHIVGLNETHLVYVRTPGDESHLSKSTSVTLQALRA